VTPYFTAGTRLPLWTMYVQQSSFVTGLANARAELPAVLRAVAEGRLRTELVTGLLADWEDAPSALLTPVAKVSVTRPQVTGGRP
jgi:hypothetical protein